MTSVTAQAGVEPQFCAIPSGFELKRRSVQGSVVSLVSQGLRWILSLASIAVLARLLTPEDFGLIAMVYAVIDFAELCMDLGLGTATIQAAQTTHRQASTLFWLNLALSGVITAAVAAAAPLISSMYREPRLTQVVLVLSLGFVVMGLGMQHRALLNRQMRFGALNGIELVALVVSALVAIGAAYLGLRYWSLVIRHFVYIIIGCAGVWLLSGWRPQQPSRGSGVRDMIAFGANLTGFYFVQYFARNMDRVFLGWQATTRQVGLYDRICHLALVPIMQITWPLTRVAIPALANLRDDPDRYRHYYCRGLLLVATMGMPGVVFLFFAAEDVIRIMLGAHWLEAAPVLRAIAPAAFASTISVATTWVYNSLGRADRQFRWGLLSAAATIVGFLVGVHWGAVGVAAAMSIVTCGLTYGPPGILYCYRVSPLKPMDLVAAIWRPVTAAIGAGFMLFVAARLLPQRQNALLQLLFDAAVYVPAYLSLWCLLPKGASLVREIIQLEIELRTKASPQDPASVERPTFEGTCDCVVDDELTAKPVTAQRG